MVFLVIVEGLGDPYMEIDFLMAKKKCLGVLLNTRRGAKE